MSNQNNSPPSVSPISLFVNNDESRGSVTNYAAQWMKNSSTFDATAVPPPQLSLEELVLYFFQCIDFASEPSSSFCNELFLRWEHMMGTIKYRQACRIIIERLFHGGSAEVIGCSISRTAAETTRKLAPDIFLEVFGNMTPYIDLEQLIAIETQLQHLFCRKTISPEILLIGPVTKALAIDFFQFSFAIHLRWSQHFTEQCYRLQWVIPPQSRSTTAMWYVGKKEFLQRFNWICPFILPLLQSPWMRNLGGVLTGSILPLCILKHEIYTDTKEEFLSYYRELYKTCAIDIFFANILPCNIQKIVHEFIEMLNLISCARWKVHAEMRWDEDDSCFARKRRGVTFTIRLDRDQLEFPDFQLIFVRSNSIIETISQNHLPCVRALFDGNSLFVTATCFASWMSRFIENPLLFGSTISAQRRSKTVFKYAMRGFGFDSDAMKNIRLPSTLVNWLNTNKGSSNVPLPPWHPLYNPLIWHKFMSSDRVTELFECAE